MDDLLVEFLTEANESLAEADQALLKLERTPGDQGTLSLIFRLVHTIKGTCGFLGLPRLESVAHAAESVLGRVRDGELPATPDLITAVLRGLDQVKAIVACLAATGAEPAGDDKALIATLLAIAEGQTPVAETPRRKRPKANSAAPASALASAEPAREPTTTDPTPDTAAAATPDTVTVPSQTIRVGVDVLENLMTLVSELVLTRNQLVQFARTREDAGLAAPLQRLSHITSELQEGVMKTRMQPIGIAWNKLPRLVRDLTRDLGKRIELVMQGQDTELDRQVLELIRDPLTHMVRNSADHGLESPAERRAAGKPEQGRITLNAFHEGGYILIEIADDGRGLPVERIRAKLLSRGLATEAELAAMPEARIQQFIFNAGFSTAAEVTSVSGRGVGMDVVKTNIERIGGTISLRSRAGLGTTFTIKIPLTLAIVSALIVGAAGERFAIPQLSVAELVSAGSAQNGSNTGTEQIGGVPVLRLRDRLLPLVNLADLLQLPASPEAGARGKYIVVTSVGSGVLGIVVDAVFDTEEIVVKPIAPILRHITMFGGNTILGDGAVIMILDPNGIARATGLGGAAEARASSERAAGRPAMVSNAQSEDLTALLLFRAGSPEPKAVPLGLVARLEHIPRERIEVASGRLVTQYRDRIMPLIQLDPAAPPPKREGTQPVLVFTEGECSTGLMVDEIIDVVEDRLRIELGSAQPGILGSAVIAGRATDVIDMTYWLGQAGQVWFEAAPKGERVRQQVLVVEDSSFFRQLLLPTLSAAGYHVTATDGAVQALALREAGQIFDVIVSDIEMPELDGLAFARHVRGGGAWAGVPLIALSGRNTQADIEAGRRAGFDDYVAKADRGALLDSLKRCLHTPVTTQ